MRPFYREILVSLGLAATIITVCVIAIALGVLLSFKLDGGNESLAAAFAAGIAVLVLLLLAIWWNKRKAT
jgi:hypothetical protein